MTQTKEGRIKAKKTIIERYGKDFFRKVGAKGGNPMLLEQRNKKQGNPSVAT